MKTEIVILILISLLMKILSYVFHRKGKGILSSALALAGVFTTVAAAFLALSIVDVPTFIFAFIAALVIILADFYKDIHNRYMTFNMCLKYLMFSAIYYLIIISILLLYIMA